MLIHIFCQTVLEHHRSFNLHLIVSEYCCSPRIHVFQHGCMDTCPANCCYIIISNISEQLGRFCTPIAIVTVCFHHPTHRSPISLAISQLCVSCLQRATIPWPSYPASTVTIHTTGDERVANEHSHMELLAPEVCMM